MSCIAYDHLKAATSHGRMCAVTNPWCHTLDDATTRIVGVERPFKIRLTGCTRMLPPSAVGGRDMSTRSLIAPPSMGRRPRSSRQCRASLAFYPMVRYEIMDLRHHIPQYVGLVVMGTSDIFQWTLRLTCIASTRGVPWKRVRL